MSQENDNEGYCSLSHLVLHVCIFSIDIPSSLFSLNDLHHLLHSDGGGIFKYSLELRITSWLEPDHVVDFSIT